jgi:hypothetical protein
MTNTQHNKKIQNFFSEYIIVKNPAAVDENGMMKKETVKEAADLLIRKNVFSSVKDMRLQALKDYNILLPTWIFEWVKENKE